MRILKRTITGALKIGVSAALMIWLLQRIGLETLWQQVTSANPLWILVAAATFAVSNVIGALQWHILLRLQHVPISFGKSLSLYHVGLFFNNFLIGNIGGDALRIYDIRKLCGEGAVAASTVAFDRFIGFFTLTTMAMIFSLASLGQLASLDIVYITAVILVVWLVAFYFLFNEKAGSRLGRLLRPMLPRGIAERLQVAYRSINRLRSLRKMLALVFAISVVVQTLRILTHYWTALSVGAITGVHYFFIFVPIIALVAGLPVSFGGLGVREQSAAVIFGSVGLAASQVVAFEFLAYAVAIFTALPGGLAFALRKEAFRREVEAIPKERSLA